jgi:lycopene cyclase domain-containing protein
MKLLYLALDLLTISYPLARSFEHRIHFVSKWKSLFTAMAIVGSFFIVWDVFFTKMGIWGFNEEYLTGFNIINLPVEEWLFFVSAPFSCMFIYEVMNYFVKKDILGKAAPYIAFGIGAVVAVVGILHIEKLYTSITFLLTAVLRERLPARSSNSFPRPVACRTPGRGIRVDSRPGSGQPGMESVIASW